MQEIPVRPLGGEDPLEEEMATHSSILAGKSMTEEPGRIQSMGLQRVGNNRATEHTEHSGKVSKPCSVSEEGWTIIDKSYRKLQTAVCARAKSLPSCLTLCDPVECSPPGFSVHGILQAKILERVAMASSRGASRLRDRICGFLKCPVSAGGFLNTSTPREAP